MSSAPRKTTKLNSDFEFMLDDVNDDVNIDVDVDPRRLLVSYPLLFHTLSRLSTQQHPYHEWISPLYNLLREAQVKF